MPELGKRFSLVMATAGRVKEVEDFMESLESQPADFELIVVDQNPDERLAALVERFRTKFPLRYHRSAVRKLSHARNLGLRFCTGDIIGFPDDDCAYQPGFLSVVERAFRSDPSLGIVSGIAVSPTGAVAGRWSRERGPINLGTVWISAISFNLFLRREIMEEIGGFDENLGVGSRFGSGEETDIVVRALKGGSKAVFDPSLAVVHPDKRLTQVATNRAFSYGAGTGYVLRKHGFKLATCLTFIIRPTGGFLLSLAMLRTSHARYYWHTIRGRIFGFFAYRDRREPGRLMGSTD